MQAKGSVIASLVNQLDAEKRIPTFIEEIAPAWELSPQHLPEEYKTANLVLRRRITFLFCPR